MHGKFQDRGTSKITSSHPGEALGQQAGHEWKILRLEF